MRALRRGAESEEALRGEVKQEREAQEGKEKGGENESGGLASFRCTEAPEETIATATQHKKKKKKKKKKKRVLSVVYDLILILKSQDQNLKAKIWQRHDRYR
jgi:hypothetical protein